MLNELLNFNRSLESWGIKLKAKFHPIYQSIPRKAYHCILNVETMKLSEFPDLVNLGYFFFKNTTFPTFKFDPNKTSASQVENHIKRTIAEIEVMDCSGDLKAFAKLVKVLKNADVAAIYQLLKEQLAGKPLVYVGLDIKQGKLPCGVQSHKALEAANYQMLKLDSKPSGELDFFGNDAAGFAEKGVPVKCHKTPVRIYSKNEDSDCFKRFGLNSTEACKIGIETRSLVANLLREIVKPEHEFLHGKGEEDSKTCLWWMHFPKKKPFKYLILTSLAPQSFVFDGDEDWALNDYKEETQKFIDAYQEQNKDAEPKECSVVMIRIPSNGACNVEYSLSKSAAEVIQLTKAWNKGLENRTNDYVPNNGHYKGVSVRQFFKIINQTYTCKEKKWQPEPLQNPVVKLQEVYEFYSGSLDAIATITRVFARVHSEVIAKVYTKDQARPKFNSLPWDFGQLVSMEALILHKNNLRQETFMNNWAYQLGMLMQTANRVHSFYFTKRKMEPPAELIGSQFQSRVRNNPRSGLADFYRAFDRLDPWMCRNWLAATEKFSELSSKLNAAVIPVSMSSLDSIAFTDGLHGDLKLTKIKPDETTIIDTP